jgi:hypothetical protein
MNTPSEIEIADVARFAAQTVLAIRDTDPARAERIETWARRRCAEMYAQRAAATADRTARREFGR